MLKMAILGPGRWAQRLVGSVQGKSQKVEFTAAASRQPEKHTEFGEKFGIPVLTYEDVLADSAVDAIIIATPHSEHVKQALSAAKAGKHVFVEKPLALTKKDARQIIRACDQAGVRLGHGFNRRFSPAYLEMLRGLHASEIGELLHLEGQFSGPSGYALKSGAWRAGRQQCPAGAMTARGIHALDAMISMAGPVTSIFAHSNNRVIAADVDDVTSGLLRFASGATGYVASHHATAEIWRLQIYGSKGWMEMRGDTDLVVCTLEDEARSITLTGADKEQAELEAFADFILAGKSFPVTNAQALNGIAVIEAMVTSSQTGQVQPVQ